jgi:hypothetical protein
MCVDPDHQGFDLLQRVHTVLEVIRLPYVCNIEITTLFYLRFTSSAQSCYQQVITKPQLLTKYKKFR